MTLTHTLTCSACYSASTETLCVASPAMTRKRRKSLSLEFFLQFFILSLLHSSSSKQDDKTLPHSSIKSYQVVFCFSSVALFGLSEVKEG